MEARALRRTRDRRELPQASHAPEQRVDGCALPQPHAILRLQRLQPARGNHGVARLRSALSITKFGLPFLWDAEWNPVTDEFGALVPIVGTLVTSCIALSVAIPVSFGIAIFLTELSPVWLRRPLGTAIEMLAAIPSIIYGMWGLFIFAPIFQQYAQPFLAHTLGEVPALGVLFSGPAHGHRHARRERDPRGDGDSVHHRGHA
jgi:hypothetical protein